MQWMRSGGSAPPSLKREIRSNEPGRLVAARIAEKILARTGRPHVVAFKAPSAG